MSDDCFKIYDINLVEQAVVSVSTENLIFPKDNVKDPRRSKVFRSLTNSDTMTLDFQETSEINAIFFVADKRAGFGVSSVTVEFNATSDFTTPAFSISVPLSVKFGIGYVEFPMIEYRFARIVMSSSLSYCELSNVFIGKNIEMDRSISFGWTIKDDELSNKTSNRYGQQFTDIILRQKTISFAFRNMKKEDLESINNMVDRVGESKPFYIKLGNAEMVIDHRRFSGPVMLTDTPTETNAGFNRWNLPMSLKEVT